MSEQALFLILALFSFFTLSGLINVTTVLMAAMRETPMQISHWEPFVWELSSAYATLALIPLISRLVSHVGWLWENPLRSVFTYAGASLVFCALHVTIMVVVRKALYAVAGRSYNFADSVQSLAFEIVYEVRQDVWSFFSLVIAIGVYRYLLRQWLGDVATVEELPDNTEPEPVRGLPQTLLLKKHGKEYLIKTRSIQWAEASGNYLNLHVDGACYPMRITMGMFISDAAAYGFIRTHRSYLVNPQYIDRMTLLPSGDGEIAMKDGEIVRLSWRYRKDYEEHIAALTA